MVEQTVPTARPRRSHVMLLTHFAARQTQYSIHAFCKPLDIPHEHRENLENELVYHKLSRVQHQFRWGHLQSRCERGVASFCGGCSPSVTGQPRLSHSGRRCCKVKTCIRNRGKRDITIFVRAKKRQDDRFKNTAATIECTR